MVSDLKPKFKSLPSALSLSMSDCLSFLWLLTVAPLTLFSPLVYFHVPSLCVSPDCLGLSLCFSYPRHPQEDPKPLTVPALISSMFVDVEDSLAYWDIPEASCSTVVSQSAFIKWLLFTEHSWWCFGQRRVR